MLGRARNAEHLSTKPGLTNEILLLLPAVSQFTLMEATADARISGRAILSVSTNQALVRRNTAAPGLLLRRRPAPAPLDTGGTSLGRDLKVF